MFYGNLIPYYSPYEEQELLRQLNTFNQHQQQHRQQHENSFYYYNKRRECSTSSLINSSLSNNSTSTTTSSSSPSSSTNLFPTSSHTSISKKIADSDVDALSFCHTIYITIKKRRNTTPSCSSPSSLNYSHQSPGDSQLLLLPDICCTIPASKLSCQRCMILNIISSATLSLVNLLSYTISLYRHVLFRLHHQHRYSKKRRK